MPPAGLINNGPITLKTIAEELGVSVTTVARALKGGERISEDMVTKVKKTATRLGYVRNLAGSEYAVRAVPVAME